MPIDLFTFCALLVSGVWTFSLVLDIELGLINSHGSKLMNDFADGLA